MCQLSWNLLMNCAFILQSRGAIGLCLFDPKDCQFWWKTYLDWQKISPIQCKGQLRAPQKQGIYLYDWFRLTLVRTWQIISWLAQFFSWVHWLNSRVCARLEGILDSTMSCLNIRTAAAEGNRVFPVVSVHWYVWKTETLEPTQHLRK